MAQADPYGLIASGLPPEIAAQAQGLTRQQQVAQAMLAQSQSPLDVNRTAGGYVIPISPFEGLAKVAQAYMGRQGLDAADKKFADLGTQYNQMTADEIGRYVRQKSGMPGSSEQIVDEQAAGGEGAPATITAPGVAADPKGAVMQAMLSRNPALNRIGAMDHASLETDRKMQAEQAFRASESKEAREARAADRALMLEARAQEATLSREARAEAAREAATLRRELAAAADATRREIAGGQNALRLDLAAERAAAGSKPPPGYRMLPNGTMEAIPGGPADTKIQGAYNADTASLQGGLADLDRLSVEANKVLNHPGLKSITGMAGKIPNMPGSKAADAEALLGTLKSQVGFGVLQAMRNASKTGGALGSVSDAEGKRLEANLASLEKAQSFEQFQESLGQIIKFSDEAKERMRAAYNTRHQGRPTPGAPAATPGASGGWSIKPIP